MDNIFLSLARNVAYIFYSVAKKKHILIKSFPSDFGWTSSSIVILR